MIRLFCLLCELLIGIRPVRLRQYIEKLGVIYIKFVQLMCIQDGFFAPATLVELRKLHSDITPERIDLAVHKDVIIENTPIACGSIAQVYKGTYDGHKVAVKILRPSVSKQLARFKFISSCIFYLFGRCFVTKKLKNIYNSVLVQMDFEAEMENMSFFKERLGKIIVPRVYNEVSGAQCIVMEFIEDLETVYDVSKAQNKSALCESMIELVNTMMFSLGRFHADMHPGNIYWKGDQMVMLDFGLIGYLSKQDIEDIMFFQFNYCIDRKNDAARHMLNLLFTNAPHDDDALMAFVRKMMDGYFADNNCISIINSSLKYALQSKLPLTPRDVLITFNTCMMSSSALIKIIDPDFPISDTCVKHLMNFIIKDGVL